MEVKFKADPTGTNYRNIITWETTGIGHETSIAVNPSGRIRLGQYDHLNGEYQDLHGSVFVRDNEWHHVAVVKSGDLWTLYVDGIQDGTLTLTPNNQSSSNLTTFRVGTLLSSQNTLIEFFKGDIDEVRIWDYSLCEVEVQNNMNCELIGDEEDLLSYY